MLKIFSKTCKSIILALFVFFIVDKSVAKISDDKIEESCKKVDAIIEEGIKKFKIPGAIFVVSKHDKVMHSKVFGKDTVGDNAKKITEETLFPISSLSKNVTSILIGALVDDKKLNLDDKVSKYLPDLFIGSQELTQNITIRDLVSHRSGFKHFAAESLFTGDYSIERIINALKILKPKPGKFRKEYGYQNIIYGLVGYVIEKAMGENYETLVKKYIFDKMNMEHSSAIPLCHEESFLSYFWFRLSNIKHSIKQRGFFNAIGFFFKDVFTHKTKLISTNHSRYNEIIYPQAKNDFFQRFAATSGISFSAKDLAKWMQMLANKGKYNDQIIVSEKTFDELTSKMVIIDNIKKDNDIFCSERFEKNDLHYGVGIYSAKYSDIGQNAKKIMCHLGGTYGSSQYLAYSLDEDIGVSVICNLGGISHTLFAEYMVLQFLDYCFNFKEIDWIQKEEERLNKAKQSQLDYRKQLSKNITAMDNITKYTGSYYCDLYGEIKITENDNHLILDNGIRQVKLQHVNGHIFTYPSKDLLLSFFDADEYVAFYKNKYGKFESMRLSSFHENDSVFIKK